MDSYRLPWMSDELAMFRDAVRKFVGDQKIGKVIVVPGRLVNVVV